MRSKDVSPRFFGRLIVQDVPRVHCPACGEQMKLKDIVPDENRKSIMHFRCECRFSYSMSARAKCEYRLATEDA